MTESTERPEAPSSWMLLRVVAATERLGIGASIEGIRSLNSAENDELNEAEEAFAKFGPTWSHSTMARLAGVVRSAIDRMKSGMDHAGGQANQADMDRAWMAIKSFAVHVTDLVVRAAHTDGQVEQAAALTSKVPAIVTCRRIAAGENSTLEPDEPRLVRLRFEDGSRVHVLQLVGAAALACELIADAELTRAEPTLLAAGAVILRLHAEVVWGQPAVMPAGEIKPGKMTLNPRAVQSNRVEPVLRACAIAKSRVARRVSTGVPAAAPNPTESEETQLGDVTGAPALAAGSGTPDLEDVGVPADPVDVTAFLREVATFSEATERRWSGALGASIADDVKVVSGKAQSLASVLGRMVIRNAPATLSMPGLPITPQTANELSLEPLGTQQDLQHGLAALIVLLELKQALEALKSPTMRQFDLVRGTSASWWKQRGFVKVQDHGEVAARVIAGPIDAGLARRRMGELATAAWSAGLPEGCLIYLVAALDRNAEKAGPLASACATLHDVAKELAEGQSVSLDLIVPLCRFWLDELARRTRAEPPFGRPT